LGYNQVHEIAPIMQFQFVQKTLEIIEVNFVVGRPLSPAEERQRRARGFSL